MGMRLSYQYKNIFDDLLQLIRNGEIKPGDKLPTEAELADRYNVSRITSKRALNMLADRGYVTRHSGKGTFLNPVSGDILCPEPKPSGKRLLGLVADQLFQSFGLTLFYELNRTAYEEGFRLYLRSSECDQQRESEEINYLRDIGAEGIFVIPTRAQYYNEAILRLMLDHYPVYILDSALSGIQVPFVSTSNHESGAMLANHLYELGHRHIALATVDTMTAVSLQDRKEGYNQLLLTKGLPYRKEYVIDGLMSGLTGMDTKRTAECDIALLTKFFLAHSEVSAIVVLQHTLASLVQRAAEAAGHIVPGTLSIAVFDEIYDASGQYVYTHIKQNETLIAREAMRRMLDTINGKSVEMECYIPPDMMLGYTTGPVRSRYDSREC